MAVIPEALNLLLRLITCTAAVVCVFLLVAVYRYLRDARKEMRGEFAAQAAQAWWRGSVAVGGGTARHLSPVADPPPAPPVPPQARWLPSPHVQRRLSLGLVLLLLASAPAAGVALYLGHQVRQLEEALAETPPAPAEKARPEGATSREMVTPPPQRRQPSPSTSSSPNAAQVEVSTPPAKRQPERPARSEGPPPAPSPQPEAEDTTEPPPQPETEETQEPAPVTDLVVRQVLAPVLGV